MTGGPKPRVLIIPHQPLRNVRVRAVEMARYLAATGDYEVYILRWTPSPPSSSNLPAKLVAKLKEAWHTMQTPMQMISEELDPADFPPAGSSQRPKRVLHPAILHWVELPYILAPAPLCQIFNRYQLNCFVRTHDIQAVLSANAYHFPMPDRTASQTELTRIYDVVDDHLSPDSGPHWRATRQFTRQELTKADRILTISHGLQHVLREEGFPQTRLSPNGVNRGAFQAVSEATIEVVKSRFELHGHAVIGYIGNHGWWAGMDLLLEAFDQLPKMGRPPKLLIVGPGEDLARFQQQTAGRADVVFTGPVLPREVAAYFHACDLGVLPFQLNPFTHHALPLKVLEFGAARKPMLATPLQELQTLAFPHVTLVPPEPTAWSRALTKALENPLAWQDPWDAMIARYDWREVLAPLKESLPNAAAV